MPTGVISSTWYGVTPVHLQHISLANTLIAFCAAPVIIEYAEVSYASRVGLAASLVLFGVITTGEPRVQGTHILHDPYKAAHLLQEAAW
jgi:hypothetical protein